ncbi:MAG: class I SAM-dependent methyltransferase [Candidatus Omnitrophica bacterium]|nr:class I SAM-dependent methyltransferase [Candidatus Omnitrophota bacterium]
MDQRKSWDNFWVNFKAGAKFDKRIIENELASVRFRKIEKSVIERFGSFEGLKVVEIGSGRGENALLFALKGARVSLLDYSDVALDKAGELFKAFGLSASFIKADIFDIPDDLIGKFDISMSFGLAEHFTYPERIDIFDIHKSLLAERGISFVAVPNKDCFAYRVFMWLSDILGYSDIMEIPFTRKELKKIAESIGFSSYSLVGSSVIKDSIFFLLLRYILHLLRWRIMINTRYLEVPTIFDDYFGYSLVLVGRRG